MLQGMVPRLRHRCIVMVALTGAEGPESAALVVNLPTSCTGKLIISRSTANSNKDNLKWFF